MLLNCAVSFPCSRWGGVPLNVLLDEAGIKPEGKWIVASGADAAVMAKDGPLQIWTMPLSAHQNGERVRPSNGSQCDYFTWMGR